MEEPVVITYTGKGEGVTSFGATSIEVGHHAEATVILKYVGSGTHADNVEFIVGEDAQVWPMIAAGDSNSDMQYALGMRPFFDMEESAGETPETISETIDALDNQPAQEEK